MGGYSASERATTMIETNPIRYAIDDLNQRVASLRGYL
jgi:hypothetical protein